MSNKIERTIAAVVMTAVIASGAMWAYQEHMKIGIETLLKRSLSERRSVSGDVLWTHIDVRFESGEYENIATTSSWGTRSRVDFNKSKIIGEWVGEKSKEAAGGVFRGILKPSKHKDN